MDEGSGDIEIIVLKRVVEEVEDPSSEISLEEARWDDDTYEVGDVMEIPVEFAEFGRNAVMATKQRIVQRVREGERQRIREEFTDRVGELLSGEVQQIERGKIVVMLNLARDAEAIIPWREQNPRERFRQGDPIRAVLKKVDETPKGPRIILSRGDPLFVAALFKLEVPEIYQSIVEIRELAREVGGRTKIAVSSRDDSIDPVGACVGLKGSRVQAVVNELGGERIDIVPWQIRMASSGPTSRDGRWASASAGLRRREGRSSRFSTVSRSWAEERVKGPIPVRRRKVRWAPTPRALPRSLARART
ncbi:transcription termination factor NusA [Gemmatimonadota bacterium]